jgi:hypothetical protein
LIFVRLGRIIFDRAIFLPAQFSIGNGQLFRLPTDGWAGGASIIDDDRSQNSFGLLMSLNMLIETPGGFDYTGQDCMAWMKEVGFRTASVQHLVGPESMVVGIK